ncbi:hypothetical protein D1AOALGA4SA_12520 [Olavius algarvensis Delta 1 endosymbiont]|nr:hypothetical protein D1AOALGA4SA_12520 [Olavius algarvensis Delta 1 endosymbiont]
MKANRRPAEYQLSDRRFFLIDVHSTANTSFETTLECRMSNVE